MKKLAFLALSVAMAFPAISYAQESGIAVGTVAPAAKVQALNGQTTNLSNYIGKQPVLMEFWAFWCPNCKALEPSLLALQKKYAGRVKFVGVAVSVNEKLEQVQAYTKRHGYNHETVFDGFGEATEAYDVPATSYVVVLDKSGKVVYTGLGPKQDLEAAIRKAL